MAFDGLVISNIVYDMKRLLEGGRIYKIYQPEADELLLVVKNNKETCRLQISAAASLPMIRFMEENRKNPMTAPNFCMLLRKHISNGRIIGIDQPGMERIVIMTIEHLDEMGDLRKKKLITELMGKHSNIIFCDEDGTIIDSIKHISAQISSVREVLPGRTYIFPPKKDKIALADLSLSWAEDVLFARALPVFKAIYLSISGISPLLGHELCFRAGIDGDSPTASLNEEEKAALYGELSRLKAQIEHHEYIPNIIYRENVPEEFSSLPLTMYADLTSKKFDSISELLSVYYSEKERVTRIRQKSSDLRHIVQTATERTARKYDLQINQLRDTEKRDKYKLYGELLHTYGYSAAPGAREISCLNYYDGQEVTIPLDPRLTPMENAKKYFDRYGKQKRTSEALKPLIEETGLALSHLESISNALEIAREEEDLAMIREELIECGYMKGHGGSYGKYGKGSAANRGRAGSKAGKRDKGSRNTSSKKGMPEKSRPLHYISSDGFHMYVGKNNYQNDELSFRFANGKDMWFHAKKMAGSHVIVKLGTADELPDTTYEEAARLAAYYSKGRDNPKVEVDYTERRQLKKPPHSVPGYVIYHQNWSMSIEPDIRGIKELE